MNITPESVRQLLSSEDLGDRLRAVNQIRTLDRAIAFELIQVAIHDQNPRVRYAAVSQMDTVGHENLDLSLSLLRYLLQDKEPDVQAAAADCLGGLKIHAAFDDLLQLYNTTPEWLVQFSIIATLGELGDPRGFELLQSALESDNDLITTAAISSLGELGDVQAVPLLAPFATNSNSQIRYRLIQALARLGGVEAKKILETLVDDPVDEIANEAKKSLLTV